MRIATMRVKTQQIIKLVFLFPLLLVGCYTAPSAAYRDNTHDFFLTNPNLTEPTELPEYLLGFGDVLEIKFFNNDKFNEQITVRPDGRITLERIGDIYVTGMTPSMLDSLLTMQYSRIIRAPEITVIVRNFGGYQFYVLGEVNQPGGFELQQNLTIMQALALAGGPNNLANLKSVLLLRPMGENRVRAFKIDVNKVVKGKGRVINDQLYHLQAKDVIYVPKTFVANVSQFLKSVFDGILPPLDIYLRALWWSNYN